MNAFGLNADACKLVRLFLNLSPSALRTAVYLRHRFRTAQLLWLTTPMEWYLEDDPEAENERLEHPILRTLTQVFYNGEIRIVDRVTTEERRQAVFVVNLFNIKP